MDDGTSALLLDCHDLHKSETFNSVRVTAAANELRIDAFARELEFADTGDYNPYSMEKLTLTVTEFLDALFKVRLGENVSLSDGGTQLKIGADGIYVPQLYGPTPSANLSDERSALLLLDAHELVFSSPDQARTGIQLPEDQVQQVFIEAIRHSPSLIKDVSAIGFERAVLGLLREAHLSDLRLEPVNEAQGLWLVHADGTAQNAMLLSVVPKGHEQVELHVVDRINGLRDRKSSSKAVIVTQSFFNSDVKQCYGGLSDRMELVDFDRLTGMLADSGWQTREPGLMLCPVGERARHSVFISYSRKTQAFAVWLYNRLRGLGFYCFLDDVSLRPGEVILSAIQQAIAGVDSVLLCCSRDALESTWVQKEIEYALEKEKREKRKMLIPLDMDGSLFKTNCTSLEKVRQRMAVDFRNWSPDSTFENRLQKVRDAIERLSK